MSGQGLRAAERSPLVRGQLHDARAVLVADGVPRQPDLATEDEAGGVEERVPGRGEVGHVVPRLGAEDERLKLADRVLELRAARVEHRGAAARARVEYLVLAGRLATLSELRRHHDLVAAERARLVLARDRVVPVDVLDLNRLQLAGARAHVK